MADSKRTKGFLPSFNALDSPSVLSKLINNDATERPFGVVKENVNNFDGDNPVIFRYLLDESLKDAWDRLLRIQASHVPQYHIEIYLRSFYVGLPISLRQVLDSIFENDFLGGDAFYTYEKMKTIFGHSKGENIESTTLMCF
jgi:hypothetical protein